jgi:hypothetical protein
LIKRVVTDPGLFPIPQGFGVRDGFNDDINRFKMPTGYNSWTDARKQQ